MGYLDNVELEARREVKISVLSYGSQTTSADELQMSDGKLEGQTLRQSALARDHDARLSMMVEGMRSALQLTKCSLDPCIVAKHLSPACSDRWWEARVGERTSSAQTCE